LVFLQIGAIIYENEGGQDSRRNNFIFFNNYFGFELFSRIYSLIALFFSVGLFSKDFILEVFTSGFFNFLILLLILLVLLLTYFYSLKILNFLGKINNYFNYFSFISFFSRFLLNLFRFFLINFFLENFSVSFYIFRGDFFTWVYFLGFSLFLVIFYERGSKKVFFGFWVNYSFSFIRHYFFLEIREFFLLKFFLEIILIPFLRFINNYNYFLKMIIYFIFILILFLFTNILKRIFNFDLKSF
jgi:hypothetical protein